MEIKAIKTKVFKEREDLFAFIFKYIKKIPQKNLEQSILVITSKIIALSEGRTILIDKSIPHDEALKKIIKSEGDYTFPNTKLTIKNNMFMYAAGVDESNANGKIILLPKNSFKTAEIIHKKLRKIYKLKNFGVLITDSRVFPLRAGVVGVALGYAGFRGVRDYRGSPDIFGRILKVSRTDVADSLATSAVLCMGEGKEQQPLVLITDAPIVFTDKINKKELIIKPKDDLYKPLFGSIFKK